MGWLCLISSNHGPQGKARLRHLATDSPFALFVVWFSYKNRKFKVAKKAQIVQSEDGTKREISLISNYNLHLCWPTHQTSWPPCLGSSLLIHFALFYRGHILSLLEVTMPFCLKKDRVQSESPCREIWSIHWKGQRKAAMAAKQNGTAASPPPIPSLGHAYCICQWQGDAATLKNFLSLRVVFYNTKLTLSIHKSKMCPFSL